MHNERDDYKKPTFDDNFKEVGGKIYPTRKKFKSVKPKDQGSGVPANGEK